MTRRPETRLQALGKWDWILTSLIGDHVLNRKHGPCPICGGKDRYRYDNKNNAGDYFCAQCGHGDGFDLLCKCNQWDFKTAAAKVDELLGNAPAEVLRKAEQPFEQPIDVEKRRRALNTVWSEARAEGVMMDYLSSRGLNATKAKEAGLLADLRGTERLLDTDSPEKSRGPGMVALVRNGQDGAPIGLHRTFLPVNGVRTKKLMPPVEKISGAAIRLGEIGKHVVVGEGIETTLAGCLHLGWPGMAAISANNMHNLVLPNGVRNVWILVDNDRSFTGQAAAFALAHKLVVMRDMVVRLLMPETIGDDYADYTLRGGTLVEFGGGMWS